MSRWDARGLYGEGGILESLREMLFQEDVGILGIGGPVDQVLTAITGIDRFQHGVQRAILKSHGLSDIGPYKSPPSFANHIRPSVFKEASALEFDNKDWYEKRFPNTLGAARKHFMTEIMGRLASRRAASAQSISGYQIPDLFIGFGDEAGYGDVAQTPGEELWRLGRYDFRIEGDVAASTTAVDELGGNVYYLWKASMVLVDRLGAQAGNWYGGADESIPNEVSLGTRSLGWLGHNTLGRLVPSRPGTIRARWEIGGVGRYSIREASDLGSTQTQEP